MQALCSNISILWYLFTYPVCSSFLHKIYNPLCPPLPIRPTQQSRSSSLASTLCSSFGLEEADLRLLMAQAETLHPGVYAHVMG